MTRETVSVEIDGTRVDLRPTRDQVIVFVEEEQPERFRESLLVLPQTTQAKMPVHSGRVAARGADVTEVKLGEIVHWALGTGTLLQRGKVFIVNRQFLFAKESTQ